MIEPLVSRSSIDRLGFLDLRGDLQQIDSQISIKSKYFSRFLHLAESDSTYQIANRLLLLRHSRTLQLPILSRFCREAISFSLTYRRSFAFRQISSDPPRLRSFSEATKSIFFLMGSLTWSRNEECLATDRFVVGAFRNYGTRFFPRLPQLSYNALIKKSCFSAFRDFVGFLRLSWLFDFLAGLWDRWTLYGWLEERWIVLICGLKTRLQPRFPVVKTDGESTFILRWRCGATHAITKKLC